MSDAQVSGRLFAPTETDYLAAVRTVILNLQNRTEPQRHTQKYIAERCGVSAKTIQHAQEMSHALKGWVVVRLGFEFGVDAVAPILALGGVSASPDAGADTLLVARIRNLLEEPEGAGGAR